MYKRVKIVIMMQEHREQGQQCDKLVTCCGFERGLAVQRT